MPVKLEGGSNRIHLVQRMLDEDIPIMAASAWRLSLCIGRYKVQGKLVPEIPPVSFSIDLAPSLAMVGALGR